MDAIHARPTIIGLTGGIASGKSTVADMFADLGAVVVDADELARLVVEPGTAGLEAIRARFGEAVIDTGGHLNRAALGRIIFADADARRDLEAIVHPAVQARSIDLIAASPADAVIVHMIPLLVETGQQGRFDAVVVVDVPEQVQLERLVARNHLSQEDALARIRAQVSRQRRLAAASDVIDNSGSLAHTREQVRRVWARIHSQAPLSVAPIA